MGHVSVNWGRTRWYQLTNWREKLGPIISDFIWNWSHFVRKIALHSFRKNAHLADWLLCRVHNWKFLRGFGIGNQKPIHRNAFSFFFVAFLEKSDRYRIFSRFRWPWTEMTRNHFCSFLVHLLFPPTLYSLRPKRYHVIAKFWKHNWSCLKRCAWIRREIQTQNSAFLIL